MKTTILSIAAVLTLALGVSNFSYAANKKGEVSTVLTDIRHINKIEVHGNVEVYISNGDADQVKVYNNYYSEHALVQNRNGVLRISSYGADKLVVWVTAADLRSISAYDNSEVKSFGKLSAIDLEVKLYNNALANLDLDAYSAKVTLNDRAKANLDGNAAMCEVRYDQSSTVNNTNLVVGQFVKTVSDNGIVKSNTELVTTL